MAIDSADHNPHGAGCARRWQRCTPRRRVGAVLGLSALFGLAGSWGCSKGGAPDLAGCVKLTDPLPGDTTTPPLRVNYAMLRASSGGATIAVPLEGVKGSYAGMYVFSQCDQQDNYTVAQVALVDKNGSPVAIAASPSGSSSYTVTYEADKRTVTGLTFANNVTSYMDPVAGPAITLQSLTLSPVSPATPAMANQGDLLTVQAAFVGDPCGIRDSQWWLTSNLTGMVMTTAPQKIPGGSGSVGIRVPPTAAPGSYGVAGQVTLSTGRTLQVRLANLMDPNYTIFDANNKAYPTMTPKVPVVSVMVAAKPDVDKTAPAVISLSVSPTSPVRCGTMSLSLRLKDDVLLPAGQQVKVWLGRGTTPKLFSATVVGSEYLSGTVQLPLDAPGGVWYAWPELIRDAAGNEAKATFMLDGKFALTNPDGMAQPPVPAAMFNVASNGVELPDAGGPVSDLAMPVDLGGQPDMATPLPAVLTGITVMPGNPKPGEIVRVYATWTDNANIL